MPSRARPSHRKPSFSAPNRSGDSPVNRRHRTIADSSRKRTEVVAINCWPILLDNFKLFPPNGMWPRGKEEQENGSSEELGVLPGTAERLRGRRTHESFPTPTRT